MSSKISVELVLIDKFSNSFTNIEKKFSNAIGLIRSNINSLINLPNLVGGYLIKSGIESLTKATTDLQSMQFKMRAATGDAAVYGDAMKFMYKETERMGVSLQSTANEFANFTASGLRSGMSWGQVKNIFTQVSETMVSLHLNANRQQLVWLALSQMASKGTVSMEELRRQLGESLPGALEIGAKAMGKTTFEFNKMVSEGKVLSADFLPKFAKQMREELGGSFDDASKGLQANLIRLSNAWFVFKTDIGGMMVGPLIELLDSLKVKFREFSDYVINNKDQVKSAFTDLFTVVEKVISAFSSFVKFLLNNKDEIMFVGMVAAVIKVTAELYKFSIAIKALGLALMANPLVLITSAIAGLGLALVSTHENWRSFATEFSESKALQEKAREIESLYLLQKEYNKLIVHATYKDTDTGLKESVKPFQDQEKTYQSIKKLEAALSDLGHTFTGTLSDKALQAEIALKKLQGIAKDASETLSNLNKYSLGGGGKPEQKKGETYGESSFSLNRVTHAYNTIGKLLPVIENVKYASMEMWAALSASGDEAYQALSAQLEAVPVKAENTFNTAAQYLEDYYSKVSEKATGMKYIWYQFIFDIENQFKSMYDTLTDLNMSWADKGKNILQSFYRMATDLVWKYVKEYISALLIGKGVHTSVSATEKGQALSTAAAEGTEAATKSAKGVASTPYVGAILAVAAIAAVLAAVYSAISKAKSADIGTTFSSDGLYKVHKNEYIGLPRGSRVYSAPESQAMDYRGGSQSTQNTSVNVTINNPGSSFVNDLARMIRNGQADSFISDLRVKLAGY